MVSNEKDWTPLHSAVSALRDVAKYLREQEDDSPEKEELLDMLDQCFQIYEISKINNKFTIDELKEL